MFLLDNGVNIYIYVGSNNNPSTIKNVFGKLSSCFTYNCSHSCKFKNLTGKNSVNDIPDVCYNLPNLETPSNEALHEFINTLNEEKPFNPTIQVIRCVLFIINKMCLILIIIHPLSFSLIIQGFKSMP